MNVLRFVEKYTAVRVYLQYAKKDEKWQTLQAHNFWTVLSIWLIFYMYSIDAKTYRMKLFRGLYLNYYRSFFSRGSTLKVGPRKDFIKVKFFYSKYVFRTQILCRFQKSTSAGKIIKSWKVISDLRKKIRGRKSKFFRFSLITYEIFTKLKN